MGGFETSHLGAGSLGPRSFGSDGFHLGRLVFHGAWMLGTRWRRLLLTGSEAFLMMRHDPRLGFLDDDFFLYDDYLTLLARGIMVDRLGRTRSIEGWKCLFSRFLRGRLKANLWLLYEIRLLLRILGIVRHTLPLRFLIVLVLET